MTPSASFQFVPEKCKVVLRSPIDDPGHDEEEVKEDNDDDEEELEWGEVSVMPREGVVVSFKPEIPRYGEELRLFTRE